jgi:NAD(P)-dependent dehydrogenase (short-subunit alcohol dehydrogenase family)
MLTKLFMAHFGEGASIVNISSSRDRMSQPDTESYSAAKGGIAALTHAMAISLAGKVRVNSISPVGSIPILKSTAGLMPHSIPQNGWEIRWISLIWCLPLQ